MSYELFSENLKCRMIVRKISRRAAKPQSFHSSYALRLCENKKMPYVFELSFSSNEFYLKRDALARIGGKILFLQKKDLEGKLEVAPEKLDNSV